MKRMHRMKPLVRMVTVALFASAFASSSAFAASVTFVARVGGALEGPQHTIRSGPLVGGAVEWSAPFGAWGVDAHGVHASGSSSSDVDVLRVGVLARHPVSARAGWPYVEAGVGVTQMTAHAHVLGRKASATQSGPDGWLGIGYPVRLSPRLTARLDARYHAIVTEMPAFVGESGNVEDYFGLSAAVAFGD